MVSRRVGAGGVEGSDLFAVRINHLSRQSRFLFFHPLTQQLEVQRRCPPVGKREKRSQQLRVWVSFALINKSRRCWIPEKSTYDISTSLPGHQNKTTLQDVALRKLRPPTRQPPPSVIEKKNELCFSGGSMMSALTFKPGGIPSEFKSGKERGLPTPTLEKTRLHQWLRPLHLL